jgi:hypothetical protein
MEIAHAPRRGKQLAQLNSASGAASVQADGVGVGGCVGEELAA